MNIHIQMGKRAWSMGTKSLAKDGWHEEGWRVQQARRYTIPKTTISIYWVSYARKK